MEVATKIKRTKKFDKDLEKIPDNVRKKFILWVFMVESQGLREVRKHKGFHDEPLKGDRKGQRSIRLNKAYRAIYREVQGVVEIL
ncbi:MAG: type II toxin-antitoxin system RelE/ParE family toxin, partial [Bacteriovoracaceae bacterium]